MKIKLANDHKLIQTDTCGEIREILSGGDHEALDLALAVDIKPTKGHFHKTFDEIYFVLDGAITLRTFDPVSWQTSDHHLITNELCLLTKGIHHRVVEASDQNRLCVISIPNWKLEDEHLSELV